uniref:CGG triplet repeat-binding protein 1 n=1 Tax=Amphiprion ocellaris TaxID=80972 RepID=A0AAQ5Z6I9_AMPOC
MSNSNVSHLLTKITAKDCAKKFHDVLQESGGKLFCTACNIVVESKRKSSIDKHFSTVKHIRRMAETSRPKTRQITMTEAVASRSVVTVSVCVNTSVPGCEIKFHIRYVQIRCIQYLIIILCLKSTNHFMLNQCLAAAIFPPWLENAMQTHRSNECFLLNEG